MTETKEKGTAACGCASWMLEMAPGCCGGSEGSPPAGSDEEPTTTEEGGA